MKFKSILCRIINRLSVLHVRVSATLVSILREMVSYKGHIIKLQAPMQYMYMQEAYYVYNTI